MTFYVYQYKDPATLIPFYVGKGCRNRADRHLYYVKKGTHQNRYFANVVKQIWARGEAPILEIVSDGLEEKEAYDLEHEMIKSLGRKLYEEGGVLTNITLGGAGPIGIHQTPEANKQRSEKLKGRAKSVEARANMRKRKTEEHRSAISTAKSWNYELTSPTGEVHVVESLKLFCEKTNLKLYTLKNASKHQRPISSGPCKGWKVVPITQLRSE